MKAALKKNPFFAYLLGQVRGKLQERVIKKEYRYYLNKARHLALDTIEPAEMWTRLQSKLSKRNIVWPNGNDCHILYVSTPSPWEDHNLPPEIAKIASCSTYYLSHRPGFPNAGNIQEQRLFCDIDLVKYIEELHQQHKIDIVLSYLSGSHLSPSSVEEIGNLGIATFLFHLDDRISFRGQIINGCWTGSASVASAYDACLTASSDSIIKYLVEGGLAFEWPEGANPEVYKWQHLPFRYEVSFVGARYGFRAELISYLRNRGINIECFGHGWNNARVGVEDQVKIYNQSRINLGFGYIGFSKEQHFKGRDFEVPMSGGLYLTSHNQYLPSVYDIGNEIMTYATMEDCYNKIKWLLSNPEEAARIRLAGYTRATNDHKWRDRIALLVHGPGHFMNPEII